MKEEEVSEKNTNFDNASIDSLGKLILIKMSEEVEDFQIYNNTLFEGIHHDDN